MGDIMKKKKWDSGMLIPAFLLTGIGVGFLLLDRIPLAIPAFTLIGLGVGLLAAFIFRKR